MKFDIWELMKFDMPLSACYHPVKDDSSTLLNKNL